MKVGTDIWNMTSVSSFNDYVAKMKECGIARIRLGFDRDSVANLRTLVPTVRANGIEVLGLLFRPDLAPDNVDAWGNWVYDIVREFRGYINVWEIWNEPKITGFANNPAGYTSFLKEAYTRAKQVDPACKILGGSICFTKQSALDFLTGMYENGAKDYMNAVAWHPYCKPYSPEDTTYVNAYPRLKTHVRPIMESYGDYNPIWITEMGWATNFPDGDGVTEAQQAEYLVTALQMAIDWGFVEEFTIYNWKDSSTAGKFTKGLLRVDLSSKPSFFAVKDFIAAIPTLPIDLPTIAGIALAVADALLITYAAAVFTGLI